MIKRVVLPVVVILAVGSLMGMGFNSARAKNRINMRRNYFAVAATASPKASTSESTDASDGSTSSALDGPSQESTDTPKEGKTLNHPFTPVTLDEVVDLYLSDGYQTGDVVFIDARSEENFAQEHIIGSFNIDNYNADDMYAEYEQYVLAANTIVVYCGGGDCEDSIFLSTYLTNRGVSMDTIRLFEGGMKAWLNDNLEVEQASP